MLWDYFAAKKQKDNETLFDIMVIIQKHLMGTGGRPFSNKNTWFAIGSKEITLGRPEIFFLKGKKF